MAIGLNLQRQRGGGDNAARGNQLQIAKGNDIREEKPIDLCRQEYTDLVISAADDHSLLNEVMDTPTMWTKNFDLDSMDRDKFRKSLAKYVKTFEAGVTGEDKIRSEAITAIQTAINRTMQES